MQGVDVQVIILLTISYIFAISLNVVYAESNEIILFGQINGLWNMIVAWFNPGTISIYVAVGIFLIQQWYVQKKDREEQEKRTMNMCNAILREIKDHRDALTNYEIVGQEGSKIYFRNAFFNFGAYDSIVHSGGLTYLDDLELQQAIVNLYLRVSLCNQDLHYLDSYYDAFFLNDTSPTRKQRWEEEVKRYHERLTRNQNEMKDLMNGIEVKMKAIKEGLKEKGHSDIEQSA